MLALMPLGLGVALLGAGLSIAGSNPAFVVALLLAASMVNFAIASIIFIGALNVRV